MRTLAATLVFLIASSCAGASRVGAPSPLPSEAGADVPSSFVGVNASGDIVVARTSDGTVTRRLVSRPGNPEQQSRGVATLSLAAGGSTLFYSVTTDPYCGSTWSVPLEGGTPSKISDGSSSAISPDGTRLAWVRPEVCEPGRGTLVVRDVRTGKDRTWAFADEFEGPAAVVDWSADSATLFLLQCGVDACGVTTFDPATATSAQGQWISSQIDGRDYGWGAVVRRTDHLVVGVDYGDVGGEERYPLLEVDPADGRVVSELMPDWRDTVPLDYDATGRSLLAIRDERIGHIASGTFTPIASGFEQCGIWIE